MRNACYLFKKPALRPLFVPHKLRASDVTTNQTKSFIHLNMKQKFINIESGGIIIENFNILLHNDLGSVNTQIGQLWKLQEQRYGWDEYRISSYEFDKDNLIIDLLFQNRKLAIIQIYIQFHDLQEPTDWESWTEEFESKKLLKLKHWLENQIGKKTEYNWGKIIGYHDKKGGLCNFTISKK